MPVAFTYINFYKGGKKDGDEYCKNADPVP